MASSISAGTTSSTALVATADTSGALVLQTNNGTTALTLDTSQNATFAGYANLPNTFGFKNRIINGAMVIDQRNNGASVTASTTVTFTVDRFNSYGSVASKYTVQQNAGSVTPPAGFTNYLGCTSSSAYSVGASEFFAISQNIEGFNTADFGWGTANAATVTLSFRVYSSLTGTFGGVIYNSAFNRSYPFTYTISSANTWTSISITIPGDTSGTWVGATNGVGLTLSFSLGAGATVSGTAGAWTGSGYRAATGGTSVVGTSGATFYITGVQLEKGSTATSFDFRSQGTEFALCQRYYYKVTAQNSNDLLGMGWAVSTTASSVSIPFQVAMRSNPTALEQSGTAANYQMVFTASAAALSAVPGFSTANTTSAKVDTIVASGLTAGQSVGLRVGSTAGYLAWSAEL
jgi:hypothetical protein